MLTPLIINQRFDDVPGAYYAGWINDLEYLTWLETFEDEDWAPTPRADLMEESERLFGRIYDRKWAPAYGVPIKPGWKIRHGKPLLKQRLVARQHKWRYTPRTAGQHADRAAISILREQTSRRDLVDQLVDYERDGFTNVIPVGVWANQMPVDGPDPEQAYESVRYDQYDDETYHTDPRDDLYNEDVEYSLYDFV